MVTTHPADAKAPAWALAARAVAAATGTDPVDGLSEAEARRRLVESGVNEVGRRGRRSTARLVLAQLTDTMIVVLLVSAALTALIGDLTDMTVILTVVALNALLGVLQEVRAGRAIAALADLTAPEARVVRGGVVRQVPARDVVTGDLLHLAAGDIAAADARLLNSESVEVDESALTGESVPVAKTADAVQSARTPLADRTGMLLAGTVMTRGRCDAVATATGAASALGGIARALEEQRPPRTPLQRSLTRLGRQLSLGAALLCLLVAVLGLLRGEPLSIMLVTAVSLAVAAIPESLPAVVSVSLALGAQRMAARGALVRRLPAVETLGAVTVIASDKTGTLTEGTMSVTHLWTPSGAAAITGSGYAPDGEVRWPAQGREAVADLLLAGVLCNDAELVPTGPTDWQVDGDPTEGALLAAAARGGLEVPAIRSEYPRIAEVPFDAALARMTTTHRTPAGRTLTICKGAPEVVLDPASLSDSADTLKAAAAAAEELARSGHRVLAVARSTKEPGTPDPAYRLVGLFGLVDPVRASAGPAVAAARTAGITPVVITGDHPGTVEVLARRLDILAPGDNAVTGRELADGETRRAAVYARVAPDQKLDIVRSWQRTGAVVAMTGDGVNDAPALRAADIGVAMGRRGTEVAKQAADIVLTDDDFGTVVAAVAEGRRVYDNIRRFVRYGLSGGAAEILVMLAGPYLGLGVTLLPAQILWINLLTHGMPGVALGVEPAEPDVLERQPRRPGDGILSGRITGQIVLVALVLAATSLGLGVRAQHDGRPWQTMVFACLALGQLWVAMALRPGGRRFTGNLWLTAAVAADAGLVLAAVYLPPLRELLGTSALTLTDLALIAVASLGGAATVVLQRLLGRRR